MTRKNTICLWYDGTALEAAHFYVQTFPDSAVGAINRSPDDYPASKQGFRPPWGWGRTLVTASRSLPARGR